MDDKNVWYGYKYYRGRLSSSEKKAYDAIYNGLRRCDSAFSIPFVSAKTCSRIFDAIRLDTPACFHVNGFSMEASMLNCKMVPCYTMPSIQYEMQCQQIEPAMKTLLASIGSSDAWITMKKLHTYILARLKYQDNGVVAHSIIGPLFLSQGVCEGIAKLVKYTCDHLGLQSVILVGTANDGRLGQQDNHAWNAVQIDGEWYCFDFTFDLTLNETNPCCIERYDYFALSSDEMAVDHQSTEMVFAPCAHRRDFFTQSRSVVGSTFDLQNLIGNRVSYSKRDIAFKVGSSWNSFVPEKELNQVVSLKTFLTAGIAGYKYSYNSRQRVCYVRFN